MCATPVPAGKGVDEVGLQGKPENQVVDYYLPALLAFGTGTCCMTWDNACIDDAGISGMDLSVLWWVIAVLLIVGGLVGTILPALPGVPMVFGGLLLAAWITDFEPAGVGTIAVLGVLTVVAWLIDFLAAAVGAKRLGASPRAFWGAMFGAIVGIFFGLPGIILGPFVGAVVAELSGGRSVSDAGRAGVGAWIGTVVGAAAKLAIAFTMVGFFILRQFFN